MDEFATEDLKTPLIKRNSTASIVYPFNSSSKPSSQMAFNRQQQQSPTEQLADTLSNNSIQNQMLAPQVQLSSNSKQQRQARSISTGFKPATAVKLKSLPWNNFTSGNQASNQINHQPTILSYSNYDAATTATSHSRRTAHDATIASIGTHQQIVPQYNLQTLEGRVAIKPSTSSATVKPDFGDQRFFTNENLDAFSELTVSNYKMNDKSLGTAL